MTIIGVLAKIKFVIFIVAMRGTYQYPDGSEYKGEWSAEGQRDGYGVMKFVDGSQYFGMFKAGLCQGLGVMIFSDGSR